MNSEEIARCFDEYNSKLQIQEQLHRWSRGADRIDLDIMRSVFHPSANINYGYTNGPVEEFLPWVVKFHTEDLVSSAHIIFNTIIEVHGDLAHSEAGVDCRLRYMNENGLSEFTSLARYLDKWERREGDWRIIDRVSVLDCYKTENIQQDPGVDSWVKELSKGQRNQGDLSYQYV